MVANVQEDVPKFTAEQQVIYDTVMRAVRENESLQLFISARGGCGKTFLLNSLLNSTRSLERGGCIALATALTGIAAELLNLGRTFHSRFKAHIHPTEEDTLSITAQSALAKLIRRCRLIIIDEASMLHRFYLEALDRTLRDLMSTPDTPFGGKIIVMAGDFRQCLPVVPGANRAQISKICINQSHLWHHFRILNLTVNMRIMSVGGDPILEDFDHWTVSIGDGSANDVNGQVIIPEEHYIRINPNTDADKKAEEKSMKEFCNLIFPSLSTNVFNPGWLKGRCILAPTNKEVDTINDLLESRVPGNSIQLSSADTLDDYRDVMRFNTEYLNTLTPNGFPRHLLKLKPGTPLMLLRNLSPKEHLCNGTRLIYKRCLNNKLLVCSLMSHGGQEVLIPRIKFIADPVTSTFAWSRRQFPVRIAFAVTINKSQGQTLKEVGIWLRQPAFNHGQFYVAVSRTGHPALLKIALKDQMGRPPRHTDNVVYHEVLLPPV